MSDVILLDGGMGQELVRRHNRPPTALWSNAVTLEQPDLIGQLHQEYIAAGADVITLNTYTATPYRLARDADIALLGPLHRAAINQALRAREQMANPSIRIAGCLPPLVASYQADVKLPTSTAQLEYEQLVALQAEAVDLFICETMESIAEAQVAAKCAKAVGKPVWVSFTVQDQPHDCQIGTLRSGEDLDTAIAAMTDLKVDGVLINCSTPEAINASWPKLKTFQGLFGAYGNAFQNVAALKPGGTVEALVTRHELDPKHYAQFALQWLKDGASIVGGCCEITPAHIRAIAQALGRVNAH